MLTSSELRPDTSNRPTWFRADVALLVGVCAVSAAINLISVKAVSTSLVLMGEEMSVSIRDPLFSVEQHAQASVWSTNVGAPLYYWFASHLDPSYSLFSARRWKAVAMALLAPLVYLTLRRRLGCDILAATFGGLVVALLPGVAMFGWLATENGLEAIPGVAGLLLATSRRRGWWAAPVLGALSVSTYTSGLAWGAVICAVCGWRASRSDRRSVGLVAMAYVVAAGVVLLPLLWWVSGPRRLVAGGGTVDGPPLANLANLVNQLALTGRSYYFFSDAPALGSKALAGVVGLAVIVAAGARVRAMWPWLAVGVVTVALWIPAGNLPGVRRAVALTIVAALALSVALDILVRVASHTAVVRTLAAAAAGAVVVSLAVTMVGWQQSYVTGVRTLTADFPIPDGPMPTTFENWYGQLRNGSITEQEMVRDHDGLRTLAVVWMLADRQGRETSGLPTPAEIVAATVPR